MALDFQLVIDSAQPHVLADWWAETLGWDVEGTDEGFIRSMIDKGFATEEDTVVHDGQLKWKTGAAINHPDGKESGRPRILFQLVPEGKTVKNRLHLDLRPVAEASEMQLSDLEARGATFLWTGEEGPHAKWVTMADPEGNEFCVPTA
jgi:hypothetical protein